MSKEKLLAELKELSKLSDKETAHILADELLLKYIGVHEVTEAFYNLAKWNA